MATEVLWYIIPREGAYPWEPEGRRPVDLGYLAQLAGTVERLGYSGALLATDLYDVWPLGSALAASTSTRFKPLLAVHPGLISPTLLAKMALSFDTLFGGGCASTWSTARRSRSRSTDSTWSTTNGTS